MKANQLEEMSLKDLGELRGLNQMIDDLVRRVAIEDADAFVDSVETDLERILRGLEENAKIREHDGEDRLTIEIIHCLRQAGYHAGHDEAHNGHSDLVIRWKQDAFVWLGEAKIHSGYDYLWDGFLQLTTRYSSGSCNCNRGGMIVYIRNKDAASVMTTWNSELNSRVFGDGSTVSCTADTANPMRLRSTHLHKRSGLPYAVRHFGVMLAVEPEDRSARATAKKATAKKAAKSSAAQGP